MRKGDVVILLGAGPIGDNTAAREVLRRNDLRVIGVFQDAEEIERAVGDEMLRSRLRVAIVPDDTTATTARKYLSDVRCLQDSARSPDDVLLRACYPTVLVYGVFYRFLSIFEEAIASLRRHTDIDLRVFVGENASEESATNQEVLKRYVDDGAIDGYVLFKENIYGSAFEHMYRQVFPPGDSEDVVVFTDLDMTIPPSEAGWLRRMLETFQAHAEVLALSLDFDLANWNRETASGHSVPDKNSWSRRYGIYRINSGIWYLALRRSFVEEYLDGKNVFGDRLLFDYMRRMYRTPVFGRLPIACHHLSWDVHRTAPDYHASKLDHYIQGVYRRHECPSFEVHTATARREYWDAPVNLKCDGSSER
jgi:hypothetical protein